MVFYTTDYSFLVGSMPFPVRSAVDIRQTADGTIWAGHNNGLTAFSACGEKLCSFSEPDIPGGRINSLLPDGEGLWVGTQEGAAYLEPKENQWQATEVLNSSNGLASDWVNVFAKNKNELWFGSYLSNQKGGLSICSVEGNWQYLSVDEGLPHRYINAILMLSPKEVLVGVGHLDRGGLALLCKADNDWHITQTWSPTDGIPGYKVRWLFLDSVGRVWITTEEHGILLCPSVSALNESPIEGQIITKKHGLSDNEVKTIIETDSCFWLGGCYGLTRIEKAIMGGWK